MAQLKTFHKFSDEEFNLFHIIPLHYAPGIKKVPGTFWLFKFHSGEEDDVTDTRTISQDHHDTLNP